MWNHKKLGLLETLLNAIVMPQISWLIFLSRLLNLVREHVGKDVTHHRLFLGVRFMEHNDTYLAKPPSINKNRSLKFEVLLDKIKKT